MLSTFSCAKIHRSEPVTRDFLRRDSSMASELVCFVMSGGVGSRLWPLSREDNPKQFHDLSGDGSMLAKTVRRLKARPDNQTPIYLIASERHADRVISDIASLGLNGGKPIFEP